MSRTPITTRLDAELVERLRTVAALTSIAQTEIIETALADHLERIIKRRKLADLVEQAQTARKGKG